MVCGLWATCPTISLARPLLSALATLQTRATHQCRRGPADDTDGSIFQPLRRTAVGDPSGAIGLCVTDRPLHVAFA